MQLIRRIMRRARRELNFVRGRIVRPALPARELDALRIHIGCGEIDAPGFVNVDAQPYPHVHYVHGDIADLSMFSNGSADLIYMCHVLEHIPRKAIFDVLGEMMRVLKPGGVLRISVPDFDRMIRMYQDSGCDADAVMSPLLGSHANQFDIHFWIFTERSLSGLLAEAGFSAVRLWDPMKSDHHAFEDWASRSIDRDGKRYFVSLNIEAVR